MAAVATARELKARGAHVEVFAADSFGARMIDPDPLPGFAVLEQGLADSICTDYCGGYHDPLLRFISEAIRAELAKDGIDVVGLKKRGFLSPEYSVSTTGAAITEW